MKSPCEKCSKRDICIEICEKLAKHLPSIDAGSHKKEVLVDPARIEKYGTNINVAGVNPDNYTQRWLDGRL